MPNDLAIVIGGGIAGLLAASAVSPYFKEVKVYERDARLQALDEPRAGVAQGHHAHILLKRGLVGLERRFPGFSKSLLSAGAVTTNASLHWASLFSAGFIKRFPSDLEFICASRPLIERILRERVCLDLPNVEILAGHNVESVALSEERLPVVKSRKGSRSAPEQAANLVVDASGRGSHAVDWLTAAGFPEVPELSVYPNLGYASARFENVSFPAGTDAAVIFAKDPDFPQGGVLFPIENRQYIATMYGMCGTHPPLDFDGFMHYAKSLRSDLIYHALRNARQITPLKGFIKATNSYRLFGDRRRWPRGFLVCGDAVCSFNPLYGQGMTSALLATEALADRLAYKQVGSELVMRAVQRAIVASYRSAWTVATNEDLRWPGTGNHPPSLKIAHRVGNMIVRAATVDTKVAYTYLSVLHMTKPLSHLFRPNILLRALGGSALRALPR